VSLPDAMFKGKPLCQVQIADVSVNDTVDLLKST
jgi:hypothetical protein